MTRALVVVDVQNDFCEGGSLAVTGGRRVARGIGELLAGQHGYDLVVATRDWHIAPGRHFQQPPDYRVSWPVHCEAGQPGAELAPPLDAAVFDAVFDKGQYSDGYSGFDGVGPRYEPLSAYLRKSDVDALDVVGLATDYCVRATAADAAGMGFATRVITDLVAGVDERTTEAALADLRRRGVVLD